MKDINKILKEQIEKIKINKKEFDNIKQISNEFCSSLQKKLKSKKIIAEVFIGGSLAKNTLVKTDDNKYDVDIFVRFDKKYADKDISEILGKLISEKAKKVHGSRDYYQITGKLSPTSRLERLPSNQLFSLAHQIQNPKDSVILTNSIILEIIPVIKVKNAEEAQNITDLSYFHVNYVLKNTKKDKKLSDEIKIAKAFAHAQDCYGAESYIKGFSGYAIELLIIYYKSFLNFIKEIVKVNEKDKLIIDIEKFYKNKNEVSIEMNESKLQSPIILIDPTFKDRNALSGLSKETFEKFKKACKEFLQNPSSDSFKKKNISDEFKRYNDLIKISIKTNKQKGDIAGTKSKKFFDFFVNLLKRDFEIKKSGFEYNEDENIAYGYLVLENKKDEVVKGPPIIRVDNLKKFKQKHPDAFIKNEIAYAHLSHDISFEDFLKRFLQKDKKLIKEMAIKELKIVG